MNEDEINAAIKAINDATAVALSSCMSVGKQFAHAKQAGRLPEVAKALRFTPAQAELFVSFYALANDLMCLTADRMLADVDVQQAINIAAGGPQHG